MPKVIKIIIFILFISMITFFFTYWLEKWNILPTKIALNTVSKVFSGVTTSSATETSNDDMLLLEKIRLDKQQEVLNKKKSDMDVRENAIIAREQDIKMKEEEIAELEKAITDKEKSLKQISKQFENKNTVLRYNVQALLNMPPENAVDILSGYDDQTLIDTLIIADQVAEEGNTQSIVPYWLSLMDSERVAGVQKKLLYRK